MTTMEYINLTTYVVLILSGIFTIYKYRFEKPKSNIVFGYMFLITGILLIVVRFL
jgi:uncharacterized membrane protein HdeD (DUF308 family)